MNYHRKRKTYNVYTYFITSQTIFLLKILSYKTFGKKTMANVGESNQPYMYQPNLVERRRLYHHNFKIFVETKLRENFPETFVKINIVLWILIGSIGIILQILCMTNGNIWSSVGTGIWAGIICFLIALTIYFSSRIKTYQ